MRYMLLVAAAAVLSPSAANAVTFTCANTDITPTALDCSGGFDGNLFNGSPADILAQTSGLSEIGFTWDGDWNAVTPLGGDQPYDASGLTFKNLTYVGVRYGSGQSGYSAFYKFDAGAVGITSFLGNLKDANNAYLYATNVVASVPEPTTWAMMVLGLAGVGAALRTRRRPIQAAAFATA